MKFRLLFYGIQNSEMMFKKKKKKISDIFKPLA